MTARGLLAGLLALILTSCATGRVDGLNVEDPWARPNPPESNLTAIYGTVTNGGSTTDRLIAISSDRCEQTELHITKTVDGVASMRPAEVETLRLGPEASLRLEPNGLHAMCLGLSGQLAEGDQLVATFVFESGAELEVDIPVEQR